MKDRGMRREEKNRLNEIFKKPLVLLIKLKTKVRNEPEEALTVTRFKDLHYVMCYVLYLPFHIFYLGIAQIIEHRHNFQGRGEETQHNSI